LTESRRGGIGLVEVRRGGGGRGERVLAVAHKRREGYWTYSVTSSALKLLLVLIQRPSEVSDEHRVYLPPLALETLGSLKSAKERRPIVC
jgi:hypothetical protein